jgi:hypothetical protein
VLLDVFDDVFLLDLPLEATEGILDRLALLDLDLGQNLNTPSHRGFQTGALTPTSGQDAKTPCDSVF